MTGTPANYSFTNKTSFSAKKISKCQLVNIKQQTISNFCIIFCRILLLLMMYYDEFTLF